MKIYKFYKDNCSPCNTLIKMMNTMTLPEDLEIIPLNVSDEENKKMAYANGIDKTPSFLSEDGRKMIGLKKRQEIIEFLGGTE